MTDFRLGAPLYWSEIEVVSRRVNLPPSEVRRLLLYVKVLPAGVAFDMDGLATERGGKTSRSENHLSYSWEVEHERVADHR